MKMYITMEPRYNQRLFKEVVGIRSYFFTPIMVKCIAIWNRTSILVNEPRYNKHILPVPWPSVISRFHCTSILFYSIYFSLSVMKSQTTDQVLETIGSFGRYQIVLNIFFNLAYAFWWSVPVMGMVFIAGEPGWKCKNKTTCPFNETINLGGDMYSFRCDIPRKDWEFADDFTSIVTEVFIHPSIAIKA